MVFRHVRFFSFLLTAILLPSCASVSPTTVLTEQKLLQSIESIYENNTDSVGILVHVEAPDRNLSWSGAAGFSDKERTSLLNAAQPIVIASNTKTYVAAAVLRLRELDKLNLDDPISQQLSKARADELRQAGHEPDEVNVQHLLQHTSGLFDYNAIDGLFDFIRDNPKHEWTRDEQINRALTMGKPQGTPGQKFSYADTNYLLLGEIIEERTGQKLHAAVRDLLKLDELNLNETWWLLFEDKPERLGDMAEQYATEFGLRASELHPSFDLYGGGGQAATSRDMALFTHHLFNGRVFSSPRSLESIQMAAEPIEPMQGTYMMGLSAIDVNDVKGLGHGGFWGSAANYFPDLNTSVSVVILERDRRSLRGDVNRAVVSILQSPIN